MTHVPDQLYVLDAAHRPLAVLDAAQIHAQNLRHRGWLLLARDRRKRLLIHRLPHDHPTCPDGLDVVASGHVNWNQAAEEMAEHALPPEACEPNSALRHIARQECGGTGREIVDVFEITLSDQAVHALEQQRDYFFVDLDEWTALTATFNDQLTPALRTVWDTGLFPAGRSRPL